MTEEFSRIVPVCKPYKLQRNATIRFCKLAKCVVIPFVYVGILTNSSHLSHRYSGCLSERDGVLCRCCEVDEAAAWQERKAAEFTFAGGNIGIFLCNMNSLPNHTL